MFEVRDYGYSALDYAVYYGHHNLIEFLFGAGAHYRCVKGRWFDPLSSALKNHGHETALTLFNFGTEYDAFDGDFHKYALPIAISQGNLEFVQALIDCKPTIELDTFFDAISLERKNIVALFLKCGVVNLSKPKVSGVALICAIRTLNTDLVELLLKNGAHPDVGHYNTHVTPLFYLLETVYPKKNYLAVATLLLNSGANPFYGQYVNGNYGLPSPLQEAQNQGRDKIAGLIKSAMLSKTIEAVFELIKMMPEKFFDCLPSELNALIVAYVVPEEDWRLTVKQATDRFKLFVRVADDQQEKQNPKSTCVLQ